MWPWFARGMRDGWPLALLFFVLYVGLVPKYSRWRDDERYYTDAALRMEQGGDYATPRYPDGSPRFNKPILTYWCVLAGHRLFGVGFFSSRFLFLVAGAGVVWLTLRLGRVLFPETAAGLLGTVVIASNTKLFVSAIRSSPDVLLCLFLLLSLLGFAQVLLRDRREARYHLMAYLGAGLACATKGLPGLTPVLFAFAWAWRTRRRRALVHVPSIVAGLVVATFWYVWACALHGRAALDGFLGDQFADRFSPSLPNLLGNALAYLADPVVQLLPWTLLVLVAALGNGARLVRIYREHRTSILFALAWGGAWLVLATVGNLHRVRYLLPAFPVLATVLGVMLHGLGREESGARRIRRWSRAFIVSMAVFGVALLLAGAALGAPAVRAGALLLLVSAFCWAAARRASVPLNPLFAGVTIMVACAATDYFVRPLFVVSPAPEIVARLGATGPGRRVVASVDVRVHYPSQVRVLSGGRIWPIVLDPDTGAAELEKYPVVMMSAAVKERWPAPGYRVEPCGFGRHRWKARHLWDVLTASDPKAALDASREPIYLAIRK